MAIAYFMCVFLEVEAGPAAKLRDRPPPRIVRRGLRRGQRRLRAAAVVHANDSPSAPSPARCVARRPRPAAKAPPGWRPEPALRQPAAGTACSRRTLACQLLAAQAAGEPSPQALADSDRRLDLISSRQDRQQSVPGQEVAVRQQIQAPAATPFAIEEHQAFAQAIAVHAGCAIPPAPRAPSRRVRCRAAGDTGTAPCRARPIAARAAGMARPQSRPRSRAGQRGRHALPVHRQG